MVLSLDLGVHEYLGNHSDTGSLNLCNIAPYDKWHVLRMPVAAMGICPILPLYNIAKTWKPLIYQPLTR